MVVARERITIPEKLMTSGGYLGDIIEDVVGRIPTIGEIITLGLLNLVPKTLVSLVVNLLF